jgi:ABC-type cobalamin/Fe3+-siderophores transport system ATPase subunit
VVRINNPYVEVRQAVDGFNTSLVTVGCTGSGKSTLLHGRTGGEGTVRLAIKVGGGAS